MEAWIILIKMIEYAPYFKQNTSDFVTWFQRPKGVLDILKGNEQTTDQVCGRGVVTEMYVVTVTSSRQHPSLDIHRHGDGCCRRWGGS